MKELRGRIVDLINRESEDIIFTQSTIEGLNYIRNGIDWKKGDSMIVRGGTHYADYLPWIQLSVQKGVTLIDLPINHTGCFEISELENVVSQGKRKATKGSTRNKPKTPRLIALSHALYNNAAIMPVENVGKFTKGERHLVLHRRLFLYPLHLAIHNGKTITSSLTPLAVLF